MDESNYKPILRFPEFSEIWSKKKLEDTSKIITGNTPSTAIIEYYGGNINFVSPADIQNNRFIYNTITTLTDLGFSKTRKIKKGSVLFVCIGSTIGKVGQVTKDCATNQQINSLVTLDKYDDNFIYSLLEYKGQKIKLLAGTQAVPQINKSDFSKLTFYFPSLPEQTKIASFLTAVDKKIEQLTEKRNLLEQYKKGIMQQIFSQKLRFKDENGKDYPDWEEKKLGEVFIITAGGDIKKENVSFMKTDFFKYPVYANSDTKKGLYGYSNIYKIDFDCITVTGRGSLGKANARIEKFFPIVRLLILKPKFKINIFFFEALINLLNIHSESTGVPQLTAPQISTYKVKFPEYNEQTKIANFITSIEKKIELINTQIEDTQQYKKGLLQQMFV